MTSPTSSIPIAKSTRANGRSREASIAGDQARRRDLGESLELEQLLGRSA